MNLIQDKLRQLALREGEPFERTAQPLPTGPDPTVGFFGAFLVIHVLLWTVLAALTQPNLPAETLQLLTAGPSLAWGYFDQPPLAVWLMTMVSFLFAPVAWPAYFLAQVCIATCIWSAWKIGKDFLHPWTAICGAIVLEGCYFFTISSTAFTSAHLAGAFWALAILALYHGFQLEQRRYWVIVGICLGLGMLSHYSTALLFFSMLAFSLLNGQARRCWDTSWPFLAGAIAGVIILPHFWWAWSHSFTTLSTALHGVGSALTHGQFTIQFVVSQLLAVVPMLVLLIPIIAYFRLDEPTTAEDEERDFVRQYLLVVTILPGALMLALALLGGVDLGSTGLTLWTFTGVLLLLWSDLDENRIAWRKVILHSGAVGGGFAALLVVVNFMLPYTVNSSGPAEIHFPGRQLAQEINQLWKSRQFDQRLSIVGGPNQLAQNASWYHGTLERPLAYNNLDATQSVGVNDDKLREQGGIILWTDKDQELYTQENLTYRYQTESQLPNIEFLPEPLSLTWGKAKQHQPLQVHVAIVHPRKAPSVEPIEQVENVPATVSEQAFWEQSADVDVLPVGFTQQQPSATQSKFLR